MKSTILAVIAGFAALTAAQSLSSLPQCAQSCVGSSFGGCSALDIKCICSNKNLISDLSCCVAQKCTLAEQQATAQFASQLCAADGVTLPTAAYCASSSTATASSSSSGAAASSMASSMMSSTMSGSSSMSGSMASTSSAAAATTASSSATPASLSSSAASSVSTGGGSQLLGSNMGAAGAAMVALVLL